MGYLIVLLVVGILVWCWVRASRWAEGVVGTDDWEADHDERCEVVKIVDAETYRKVGEHCRTCGEMYVMGAGRRMLTNKLPAWYNGVESKELPNPKPGEQPWN